MTLIDLGNGKHVTLNEHAGKVWLSSFNGCGTTNCLSAEQAKELGVKMYQLGRKLGKG